MKKNWLRLSCFALLFGTTAAFAQGFTTKIQNLPSVRSAAHKEVSERTAASSGWSQTITNNPLPESIVLEGADRIPISGKWHTASNGRGLHNMQVDPSNPQNVHVVIMTQTDPSPNDRGLSLSRRAIYTFSSDGGKTWKTPIPLSTTKSGYPHMILFKRGNEYVPMIAAHRFTTAKGPDLESAIWVEMGHPGDGNFEMTGLGRVSVSGIDKDVIWPCIALSPDESKLYVLGNVSANPPQEMEFGVADVASDGKLTWGGWKINPGTNNSAHNASNLNTSGSNQMRVSASGKIGLLWKNANYDPSDNDVNLYFIESADGGTNWTEAYDPIFGPFDPDGTTGQRLGAEGGLDFFYVGERPFIAFESTLIKLQPDDAGNNSYVYYPSRVSLHFTKPQIEAAVNIVTSVLTSAQYDITADMPPDPVGSNIKENSFIDNPVLAPTADSNVFRLYYTSVQSSDSALVGVDGKGDEYWGLFSNIYYTETNDGGLNWNEPQRFLGNTMGSPVAEQRDYRFPMVSDFTPEVSGATAWQVAFGVDTIAGVVTDTSGDGWDVVEWFHKSGSAIKSVKRTGAINFTLEQNYPNPFNPSTTVSFTLKSRQDVLLTVTDMLGRTVATLASGSMDKGDYKRTFDAKGLPSGVYQYTLKAGANTITRSMALVK